MKDMVVTTGTVSTGGLLAFASQLDWASWSYITGIIVAVVGLLGGMYWQWRKDKRAEEMHRAVLESIKAKGVTLNDEHELD